MIDKPKLMRWRQEFLDELETILGPRDVGFSLGDVVQAPMNDDVPRIYLNFDERNTVDIWLTVNAMSGAYGGGLARWQLAHECVHLVDPSFSPPTNVMEEGIATWFQNRKVENKFFMQFAGSAYATAERLVSPLMNDGYLPEMLRLLRRNGTSIGKVTSEQLVRVAERIDLTTAEALTARFGG